MLRTFHFMLALTLAVLAFSAPTSNALSKRSFKAPARGRGKLSPLQELTKTGRKYGFNKSTWQEVIIVDVSGSTPSSSLQPPFPFTSSAVSSINSGHATIATSPPAATTPAGVPEAYHNSSSAAPSATQGLEDGEVTATPEENESEYMSPVTVGGQRLDLNFDTGSADLWVFSTRLSEIEIGSHAAYDPAKSSHWQVLTGSSWNISYGDGSGASGVVGYDTVDVGGSTVQKQCVEIATDVSEEFVEDAASDGLLGLGFGIINTVLPVPQKTFFENVKDHLSQPVFTADLEETDGAGTYEFGTIDKSKYKGDIHYVPVDPSKGFWEINTPTFHIDGKVQSCENCWGIADTGTSLLYLNRDVVDAYYAKVPSAQYGYPGGYSYDCDANLPDVSIVFGDYAATIKGSDMTYGNLSGGSCFGGLQSLDPPCTATSCTSATELQIIGDVFLKQFFAVFDGGDEPRFGIAEKN